MTRFDLDFEYCQFGYDFSTLRKAEMERALDAHKVSYKSIDPHPLLQAHLESHYARLLTKLGQFPNEYLAPDFDPFTYTPSELRMVLSLHGCVYPAKAKHQMLVTLFINKRSLFQSQREYSSPKPAEGVDEATDAFNSFGLGGNGNARPREHSMFQQPGQGSQQSGQSYHTSSQAHTGPFPRKPNFTESPFGNASHYGRSYPKPGFGTRGYETPEHQASSQHDTSADSGERKQSARGAATNTLKVKRWVRMVESTNATIIELIRQSDFSEALEGLEQLAEEFKGLLE